MKKHENFKVECHKCDGGGYIQQINKANFPAPPIPFKIFCEKCKGTGYLPVYINAIKEN